MYELTVHFDNDQRGFQTLTDTFQGTWEELTKYIGSLGLVHYVEIILL
jgi:hypothetical protein